MLRIGLTYDLRDDYRTMGFSEEALAEFDSPETVAAIEGVLRRLGHETDRIGHIRHLAQRLVAGDTWDLVFNIAEGLTGRSREAQVPALLEAYGIPYVFSDPLTLAVTLDKAIAKRLVRDAGIPTASFAQIETEEDAAKACALPFPLFVKPLAEGTGKGCNLASKVTDPAQLADSARALRARFNQPVIAEPYLPGREFTVGIVGNGDQARVIAVLEVLLGQNAEPGVYSYDNKEQFESRVTYRLPEDGEAQQAAESAMAAYRTLGCRDASRLDFRSDASGIPQFMEVNALAGLHPTHSDLPILSNMAGMTYDDLIGEIVGAALARYGLVGSA